MTNHGPINVAYNESLEKYPDHLTDRFLAIGLSKGSVIFLAVDAVDQIYARFFFHR